MQQHLEQHVSFALERRVTRSKGLQDIWKERREELFEDLRSLVDSMIEKADTE